MDYTIMILSAIAGGLIYHIFFGGRRAGPFEESLMHHLSMGKKVIVTIDEECYIFEMYGDRMRITRGIATFMEEDLYDASVENNSVIKPVDSGTINISNL